MSHPIKQGRRHDISGGASYRQGRARSYPTIFVRVLLWALPLGQEAKKSKISVVHRFAVLKGYSECLKCGKTLNLLGLRRGYR